MATYGNKQFELRKKWPGFCFLACDPLVFPLISLSFRSFMYIILLHALHFLSLSHPPPPTSAGISLYRFPSFWDSSLTINLLPSPSWEEGLTPARLTIAPSHIIKIVLIALCPLSLDWEDHATSQPASELVLMISTPLTSPMCEVHKLLPLIPAPHTYIYTRMGYMIALDTCRNHTESQNWFSRNQPSDPTQFLQV